MSCTNAEQAHFFLSMKIETEREQEDDCLFKKKIAPCAISIGLRLCTNAVVNASGVIS